MSITDTLKQKFTGIAENPKIADLQRDTVKPAKYHTNDHGVAVSDTDNW